MFNCIIVDQNGNTYSCYLSRIPVKGDLINFKYKQVKVTEVALTGAERPQELCIVYRAEITVDDPSLR